MELKGRLKLIANKVKDCNVVSDVGTDHAYIPIYLVKNGICAKAIAADVKEGPINAAIQNIQRYGLEDKIEARLGDGLKPIKPGESDGIIIAGMGGILITEIINARLDVAREAKMLLLQPMNHIEDVREWLYSSGFEIYDEELVNEGVKLYTVICARWTGKNTVKNEIDFIVGEKLVEKRDPLLGVLISRRIKQTKIALEQIEKAERPAVDLKIKYSKLIKELELIAAENGIEIDSHGGHIE